MLARTLQALAEARRRRGEQTQFTVTVEESRMCEHHESVAPESTTGQASVETSTSPAVSLARRGFLRDAMLASSGAAFGTLAAASNNAAAAAPGVSAKQSHYVVAAAPETVHWGYFSKKLKPLVEVASGDFVTLETLTHHANDDFERMIKGDPGAEAVYFWDNKKKGVNRRGAGPTTQGLTEDEAVSLMSIGVDFGITQVVDGNWGVHAIVKKSLFAGREA